MIKEGPFREERFTPTAFFQSLNPFLANNEALSENVMQHSQWAASSDSEYRSQVYWDSHEGI